MREHSVGERNTWRYGRDRVDKERRDDEEMIFER